MKTVDINKSKGFILVTVLFLISVVAVMAVVMSTTSSVQNLTTVYSLQQARAYFAAKSGLEYGTQRVVSTGPGACVDTGVALPGIDFTVNITCTSVLGINEAGNSSNVYTITSTATTGTLGDVGYVTRTVRATVNQL